MQPLFHAVQHGVKAGHAQEAYDDVFMERLERDDSSYMYDVHGVIGPHLAVMASFFEVSWQTPRHDLSPGCQSWLLSAAALGLTSLGRVSDSVEPHRAGLEADVAGADWGNAAISGALLADTLLELGRVDAALSVARQAVEHADLSGVKHHLCARRASLGQALVTSGQLDLAIGTFADAEEFNAEQLVSIQGYLYGAIILERGEAAQALERGRYQLGIAERYLGQGMGLHNIGFGRLLIGRAQDALGDAEAASSLDAAVTGLRKSGMNQYLPLALLARAAHRRRRAAAGETDLIEGIRADLAEVEDIAGEEMRLYLTDLALERARLALDVPAAFESAQAARAEAEAQTAKAAALIAETGYHRRDGELAELRARLKAA